MTANNVIGNKKSSNSRVIYPCTHIRTQAQKCGIICQHTVLDRVEGNERQLSIYDGHSQDCTTEMERN
jgi:hypothetical protein